jgi:Carbohydrate-binding module 48 (Isoamylase N-terminal domain)
MKARKWLPVGAEEDETGGVHFRVWAPRAKRVEVVFEDKAGSGSAGLDPEDGGYFSAQVPVLTSRRAVRGADRMAVSSLPPVQIGVESADCCIIGSSPVVHCGGCYSTKRNRSKRTWRATVPSSK